MGLVRSSESGKYVIDRLFGADTYALICSPYISEQYAKEIVQLAKRGRLVKVLTTDKITERNFYIRDYFKEAKRSEHLETLKTLVMKHCGQSLEHSKMYIIDDKYAVIGSANLTRPGMWKNSETINIYETETEVKAVKVVFEEAWKNALESAFGISSKFKRTSYPRYGGTGRSEYYRQSLNRQEEATNKGSFLDAIIKELKSWIE